MSQALQALAHEAQPAHDTEVTLALPGIHPCRARIATINATNFLDFHAVKGKYDQGLDVMSVQKLQKHDTSFGGWFFGGPKKGIDLVKECERDAGCKKQANKQQDGGGDALEAVKELKDKIKAFGKTQTAEMDKFKQEQKTQLAADKAAVQAALDKHTQTQGTKKELDGAKAGQEAEIKKLKKTQADARDAAMTTKKDEQNTAKEAKYAALDKEVVDKAVGKFVTCTDEATQLKCTYVSGKACKKGSECPKGETCDELSECQKKV